MAGAFLRDAVVMIGENPESLASWIAVRGEDEYRADVDVWCETELNDLTNRRCASEDHNGFSFVLAHCVRCCGSIQFQSVRVVVV